MTNADMPSLGHFVQTFFGDHLTRQRNLRPNTVLNYRDAIKLFLAFSADHHGKDVTQLGFTDVGADTILAFLSHLETTRNCCVRTRNARLAALHTFYRYVAAREPRVLALCQQVAMIPVKKARETPAAYLGKGDKERLCPVRASTAKLVRQYLRERGLEEVHDAPLLVGMNHHPLTRHGILRAVQRRVRTAAATLPSLAAKRVGAHTFRHAAAIHLLRAGNALPVVRSWLGHVSVVTTDHYTRIDLEMKRRALEATEPVPSPRQGSWQRNPDLLQWLEAL